MQRLEASLTGNGQSVRLPTDVAQPLMPFTASLNALPAVNFTVSEPKIWTSAAVDGFRPDTCRAGPSRKRITPDQLYRVALCKCGRDVGNQRISNANWH